MSASATPTYFATSAMNTTALTETSSKGLAMTTDAPMTPTPAVSAKEKALADRLGEMIYRALYEHEGGIWRAVDDRYKESVWNAAGRRLAAALSATGGEAEPVAWLQEMYGEMRMSDACWREQGAFPVYASPPSAPAGVKELGKPEEWAAQLEELQTWTRSAFLAGEKVSDEAWHKSQLYGVLCGILGFLRAGEEAARSSLQPDTQAASPTYHVVNCCNCGRIIDTREEDEGGDGWGHELSDDRWVCSPECLDAVAEPDTQAAAASAPAGDFQDLASASVRPEHSGVEPRS